MPAAAGLPGISDFRLAFGTFGHRYNPAIWSPHPCA
jgi:hypothetical protein